MNAALPQGDDSTDAAASIVPDEVRTFYAYTPASLLSNLVGAAVIAFTHWSTAPRLSLLAWLSAFSASWIVRLVLARRFAAAEPRDLASWHHWWRWWNAGALVSGAMWGLAATLLYGAEHTAAQVVLILIVTSLAVGATPVLSEQPRIFHAYVALCLLPLVVRVAIEGGAAHWPIALVLALILGLTTVLGRNYRSALQRLIALKAHTEQLAAQLGVEKAAAEVARRDAEVANRAKTKFFAAASHDLRQPLHALGLFAEALRQRSHADVEVVQLVNSINSSVDALDGLFNELLDITRIDAGGVDPAPAHFAVGEVFRKIKLHFEPTAFEKGLELRLRGGHRYAYADPMLVERIVRNLVSNAIRYTDDGGVLVAARARGDRLLLQVWDSGVGIRERERERIFDEFYQIADDAGALAPHQRKGLGLGLAICRRLADLMDAPLNLRSKPGRGSVFTLELPLGRAPRSSTDAQPRALGVGATLDGRRVLVVEDEPAVRSGLAVLLRSWGATVSSFDGAAPCLAWAAATRDADQAPELLIVDYRLGGASTGVDVIAALRARFGAGLPAIVVTGSLLSSHEQEATDHDFHLLIKPVAPSKLRAMIAFKLGVR